MFDKVVGLLMNSFVWWSGLESVSFPQLLGCWKCSPKTYDRIGMSRLLVKFLEC